MMTVHKAVFLSAALAAGVARAQQPTPCPSDITVQTVRSFAAFSHDIKQLPADQRAALDTVTARILASALPGCTPITVVLVEGYADIVRDHPEWTDAQRFSREDEVSLERAVVVRDYIKQTVETMAPALASKITFLPAVGYGRLDADPSKVAENRRVVITTAVRPVPPPKEKPKLEERADRALTLARQNGLAPMECALTLFKRRSSPGVSLWYVDAQKPITVVKGLPPISLLWQATECFGTMPRLCHEQNYGPLTTEEMLAFATNLIEDLKSTRFDPQRPDADIVDAMKQITFNAVKANQVINAHVRRLRGEGAPDKGRVQLNKWQLEGTRNANDIHSCFFKE